jgi:hypothetical protein
MTIDRMSSLQRSVCDDGLAGRVRAGRSIGLARGQTIAEGPEELFGRVQLGKPRFRIHIEELCQVAAGSHRRRVGATVDSRLPAEGSVNRKDAPVDRGSLRVTREFSAKPDGNDPSEPLPEPVDHGRSSALRHQRSVLPISSRVRPVVRRSICSAERHRWQKGSQRSQFADSALRRRFVPDGLSLPRARRAPSPGFGDQLRTFVARRPPKMIASITPFLGH